MNPATDSNKSSSDTLDAMLVRVLADSSCRCNRKELSYENKPKNSHSNLID
jgi:hypothetical protein